VGRKEKGGLDLKEIPLNRPDRYQESKGIKGEGGKKGNSHSRRERMAEGNVEEQCNMEMGINGYIKLDLAFSLGEGRDQIGPRMRQAKHREKKVTVQEDGGTTGRRKIVRFNLLQLRSNNQTQTYTGVQEREEEDRFEPGGGWGWESVQQGERRWSNSGTRWLPSRVSKSGNRASFGGKTNDKKILNKVQTQKRGQANGGVKFFEVKGRVNEILSEKSQSVADKGKRPKKQVVCPPAP